VKEVRVVGADGEQIGIMPTKEALRLAEEKNLDLVNVAPNAKPPVCRIMNYGKYKYEQTKKEKEARKNQKVISIKEIRLSATIEEHDIQTKVRSAIKFLQNEDKVKVVVRFRGREITHQEIGISILERFANEVKDYGVVERKPQLEGKSLAIIIAPK